MVGRDCNMNKKPAQMIVLIIIGFMFIATIIITILFRPPLNKTDSSISSSELSSTVISVTAMINI